jgi:C4-dicarboxylate transporter DctM subunit
MSDLGITALLIAALFLILGSGVWIGLTLTGVAWIGMQLFSSRPAGDAMAVTIWGSASSWTLTALPLFVWMGEILFRTRLSRTCSAAWRPGCRRCPGGCCTSTWSAAPSSRPSRAAAPPPAPPSAR